MALHQILIGFGLDVDRYVVGFVNFSARFGLDVDRSVVGFERIVFGF